tara:strand:- start:3408 stop:3572 length:165 start_codon:yes stop_codon:yes gene_type:complete
MHRNWVVFIWWELSKKNLKTILFQLIHINPNDPAVMPTPTTNANSSIACEEAGI